MFKVIMDTIPSPVNLTLDYNRQCMYILWHLPVNAGNGDSVPSDVIFFPSSGMETSILTLVPRCRVPKLEVLSPFFLISLSLIRILHFSFSGGGSWTPGSSYKICIPSIDKNENMLYIIVIIAKLFQCFHIMCSQPTPRLVP